MTEKDLKIAVVEPSILLRAGLTAVLKRIPEMHIHAFEISSYDLLPNYIRLHKPDVVIINPTYWGTIDVDRIKTENQHPQLKWIGLRVTAIDEQLMQGYDGIIDVFDTLETIQKKLADMFEIREKEENDNSDSLSIREKEVLVHIVKGNTNKEVAAQMFLSTHTIITHRRNITRKLNIHSTAGLTIYAIVNKLVDIEELGRTQATDQIN